MTTLDQALRRCSYDPIARARQCDERADQAEAAGDEVGAKRWLLAGLIWMQVYDLAVAYDLPLHGESRRAA